MKKDGHVILIVDDSPVITERVIDMLGHLPEVRAILTASDYEESITVLKHNHITTVLLDIKLPERNGLEILKFIAKKYPAIKVIMLTNLVSDYYKRLCKNAGAAYFIDKSKDFEMIPGILTEMWEVM